MKAKILITLQFHYFHLHPTQHKVFYFILVDDYSLFPHLYHYVYFSYSKTQDIRKVLFFFKAYKKALMLLFCFCSFLFMFTLPSQMTELVHKIKKFLFPKRITIKKKFLSIFISFIHHHIRKVSLTFYAVPRNCE